MFRRLMTSSPREFGKYCAYALILLAPGSFVVFPVMWLLKLVAVQASRQGRELPGDELLSAAKNGVGVKR